MPPMNRREALKTTGVLVGSVVVTTNGFLVACARDSTRSPSRVLTLEDESLIEEIADTLLPTTPSSPGARAAGAGAAINLLLTDCYEPEAQKRVVSGLREFRDTCKERCGGSFVSLSQSEREKFLRGVDSESQRAAATHYFGLLRELSLRAYFSSEVGMTKALRYVLVPGKWVGCVPLAKGQPAWG